MGQEQKPLFKQFNVMLPPKLIAALYRYQAEVLEETAKSIKTGDVVRQALLFWLGPANLSISEAVWKAKIEKAKVKVEKEIKGKFMPITLSGDDVASIIRQLRDALEGEAEWMLEQ